MPKDVRFLLNEASVDALQDNIFPPQGYLPFLSWPLPDGKWSHMVQQGEIHALLRKEMTHSLVKGTAGLDKDTYRIV